MRAHSFDRGAWDLANLYLASVDAELLGDDAPSIVGLSEETMRFVSPAYCIEDDPFADFIVHELGIDAFRLYMRSYGATEPYPCGQGEIDDRDRRVDFNVSVFPPRLYFGPQEVR